MPLCYLYSNTGILFRLRYLLQVWYIEDITRWQEDMNFMFEWQEQLKQKVGIMTSSNDTTLTMVTYRKYATQVPDEVAYGIYEWFTSK